MGTEQDRHARMVAPLDGSRRVDSRRSACLADDSADRETALLFPNLRSGLGFSRSRRQGTIRA
jgi:hypothetical protein